MCVCACAPSLQAQLAKRDTTSTAARSSLGFVLRALVFLKAPPCLLQLVAAVHKVQEPSADVLDLVEYFAGTKEVTMAGLRKGRRCMSFELKDNPQKMNWLRANGFAYAIHLALSLGDASQAVMAPVCSSWVWVNRSTSGRSIQRPLGDCSKDYVRLANIMVARCALVCLLLSAKGCFWLLEQPSGSLLEQHPRMQWLIKSLKLWRVYIRMGDFGAETGKPTWVYSAHKEILDLQQYKTCEFNPKKTTPMTTVVMYRDDGTLAITGTQALKGTQSYPSGFGNAVSELYLANKENIERDFRAFKARGRDEKL